jgi:hypothetical protein
VRRFPLFCVYFVNNIVRRRLWSQPKIAFLIKWQKLKKFNFSYQHYIGIKQRLFPLKTFPRRYTVYIIEPTIHFIFGLRFSYRFYFKVLHTEKLGCPLISALKGIVSWDFDGIFMILFYSFYVRQLPLDILFFNFDVFIFKLYHIWFFQLITLIRVQNLSQTRSDFGKNGAFFYFTFILYPYWVFVKSDKLLSQLIKFKYENIKFKKKCEAEHAYNI